MPKKGIKFDSKKVSYRGDREVPLARAEVNKVKHYGAILYAWENWKKLDNLENRYLDANKRHEVEYAQGKEYDDESGLHHLAHQIASLEFVLQQLLSIQTGYDVKNTFYIDKAYKIKLRRGENK